MEPSTLLWLRTDLRLVDNMALSEACKHGEVIPVYIYDERINPLGGASKWWLHHSLASLQKSFARHKVTLIVRKGNSSDIIQSLLRETNANTVYWNRRYEPEGIKQDTSIKSTLKAKGIKVRSFNASLLHEPWDVENKQGNPFKVFTPFWKHCMKEQPPHTPYSVPKFRASTVSLDSDRLEEWKLLPTKPDWAGGLREYWHPGEKGAEDLLEQFLSEGLPHYTDERDYPAKHVTSRLSPHLHFGEISPHRIFHAVTCAAESGHIPQKNIKRLLDELGWREFAHHLLYHFPAMPDKPLRGEFNHFRWHNDKTALKAWQQGKTGYPIVDAGMRELWHTGTMHNRVRMITASFLTKHLLIPWQEGAAWFMDTLVDADMAANSMNWQWVAGCGTDASPYFRIFNPLLQGKKFDPKGEYVKLWVPELRHIPETMIHTPWEYGEIKTYPKPIIDHIKGRERALEAYREIKNR